MARRTSRPSTRCPLGVNGGEYPHWSVAQICNLAVKLGAGFVELSARRVIGAGPQAVLKEIRQSLRAFGAAGALMSGSGSTIFGLFASLRTLNVARRVLRARYPDFFIERG